MCGISGIYNFNNVPVALNTLKRFTDSMAHRGPDGAGYELLNGGALGLGHRRLSILDLTDAGKQPMSFANGRYWIIYNGEVFNFQEIRKELDAKGYHFKSETDTEVILASYIEWGKNCLHKFNGMWAIAIWDEQDKELFLARDRFGIKPLYYSYISDISSLVFASETIAFNFLDGFKRELDYERVLEVIKNPNVHEGQGITIYKNIYQIIPGHYIKIKNGIQDKIQTRWYDIRKRVNKNSKATYQENVKTFYTLFKDACKIRMRSDVPIASALSGGLDSSSVYAMLHHLSEGNDDILNGVPSNWKKAITALFPNTSMDEKDFAEQVAEKYGKNNWICVYNKLDNLSCEIEEVTSKFDSISGASMNSISQIYKGIKSHGISVSLDGHGVDEMLYGYRYMLSDLFYYFIEIGNLKRAYSIKEILVNLYLPEERILINNKLSNQIKSVSSIKSRFKSWIKKNITSTKSQFNPHPIYYKLSDNPYDFSSYPFEDQLLLNDFFIYSLPTFLRDFDRSSMMNSVEVRMPFMDYRLVEFCFSLPFEQKLALGYTKRILRDALRDIVPEAIIKRTYKVGISSPLDEWFNEVLKGKVLELLKINQYQQILRTINAENYEFYEDKLKSNVKLNSNEVTKLWQAWNILLIKN
jgi:asparagine synthase (glutamine-hydrolysing)